MGSYRLLLAVTVLVSHLGLDTWVFGISPGTVAVVSFFIISGYVTTALIERHYDDLSRAPAFLLDRAMRLFPQYLFYLALAVVLILCGVSTKPFDVHITPMVVLLNALMVPANFYMFDSSIGPVNPPTWTLGLEFTFYLLAPFLVLLRWRGLAFVLSMAIFVAAFTGYINRDWFGYRLIPGTLFMFLCGSFMRPSAAQWQRAMVVVAWLMSGVLLAVFYAVPAMHEHYNGEVTMGMFIGIPVVALLSQSRYRQVDEVLGNISYGVYLNHFPLMWLMIASGFSPNVPGAWGARAAIVVLSICLSLVTYSTIERPIIKKRHRMRRGITLRGPVGETGAT